MSVKLFYPEPLPGSEIHPVFYYRHPLKEKGGGLYRNLTYTFFESVEVLDVQQADAIVLVHNFPRKLNETEERYVKQEADTAEQLGKPLYLFSCGDWSDTLQFDERIFIFRQSLYKSAMGLRDICIPTTTEDPPEELLFVKEKTIKPLVSFCGMGALPSLKSWIKYFLVLRLWDMRSLLRPELQARKIGVYWRRAMMHACERSSLVRSNFIVRRSFSGHAKSIELDPAIARKEYLENSAHSDFVLAPKGDGNYSNRFLKTLAFGRIPVLVDTDVVLPLEGVIPYDQIVVRVPMHKIHKTPELIREFYDALTEKEWKERQRLAREMFTTYLRQEAFFAYYFSHRLPI